MKKSVVLLSVSTALILTACGDNESVNSGGEENNNTVEAGNTNNSSEENESTNEAVNQETENNEAAEEPENNMNAHEEEAADEMAEDGWETEVGETVENEGGTFTLHTRQDDIDTIETGPVIIDIEQLITASGELSPDMAEIMETEELDYVQIDLVVENTGEEDITFFASQATIATSTGEQLESDMWLSDHIPGDMMAETSHSGSFLFVLENSSAEDVESVRITWSAPMNEDFNTVGEDVDIEVEF
ncbi:MAG: hypothetical protein EA344_00595 [Alkalicoccus sp.]|nr:MAG: hypothetical protein EA344_00595 [Alkalicoccus sp.]